ncbi:MAG: hypothetical protein IID46_05180 [Planctomycetes bacterium]|nr:hypothetical protein [Planctomycetota bacterium]
MKSQQRHDLKTNALERIAAQMAPFFKQNGQRIVLGLCGVTVVLAIFTIWVRSSTSRSNNAWQAMVDSAVSPSNAESFLTIADKKDYQGSQVSVWARLLSAERHYLNGIGHYFTDRSTGVDELKLAKKAFNAVLKSEKVNAVMQERALFGLARCAETMSDRDTQDAISAYERLLKKFSNSIYKDDAEKRIEILKKKERQDFYAWFSQQTTPKPEDLQRPSDGASTGSFGTGPLFPKDPDSENFNPFGDFLKNQPTESGKSDSADETKQLELEPVVAPKPPVEATRPQPK